MDSMAGATGLRRTTLLRMRSSGVRELATADLESLWASVLAASPSDRSIFDPFTACPLPQDEETATVHAVIEVARAALAASPADRYFHYWLSEIVRAGFKETDIEAPGWTAFRSRFQDMVTLGINLRGRDSREFLAAWHTVGTPDDVGVVSAFAATTAFSTFCGPDLAKALRLSMWAGDAAWAASQMLSLLAGAFYGAEGLRKLAQDRGDDEWLEGTGWN